TGGGGGTRRSGGFRGEGGLHQGLYLVGHHLGGGHRGRCRRGGEELVVLPEGDVVHGRYRRGFRLPPLRPGWRFLTGGNREVIVVLIDLPAPLPEHQGHQHANQDHHETNDVGQVTAHGVKPSFIRLRFCLPILFRRRGATILVVGILAAGSGGKLGGAQIPVLQGHQLLQGAELLLEVRQAVLEFDILPLGAGQFVLDQRQLAPQGLATARPGAGGGGGQHVALVGGVGVDGGQLETRGGGGRCRRFRI